MRYLFKIYSPYDGFYPSRIAQRLVEGRFLDLNWQRYIDVLELHDEVWIVFTGNGARDGVYVKGLVADINMANAIVRLRVRNHSTTASLADAATTTALLEAVQVRNRQVFLWPTDHATADTCHVSECGDRLCRSCEAWRSLPLIEEAHYRPPGALRGQIVVPAYWTVPARCYLYYATRPPAPWNRRATEMFGAFKVGEKRYAFPLAAGMSAALSARGLQGFDAVVPIPLSPEKAAAGELDRTSVLADELARLTDARKRPLLSLAGPISKRRMAAQGYTPTQFKARYRELLEIDAAASGRRRIVLLDDVITRGSTLSVAAAALRVENPKMEIVIAAAAQMIVKDAVADENGPAW